MEFIKSTRGKLKIAHEGFIYVKKKNLSNDVLCYECENRRHSACHATIRISEGKIIGYTNTHNHAPDKSRKEALIARARMKAEAIETYNSSQQIITGNVHSLSESASVKLPHVSAIRRTIRRVRQRAEVAHPIPTNISSMIIPDVYKYTLDKEPFLLYDGVDEEDRILIFSTKANLEVLKQSKNWFGDGTFKVVPELFFQLYTIHALTEDIVIPCVYALLPDKKESTYNKLLSEVRRLNSDFEPETFLIDFENAAKSAIQKVFPDIVVKGCFYHLSQNIYRNIQRLGLQKKYMDDENFALKVRMLPALAFLPEEQVVAAFEKLSEIMPPEAEPIVDYFEDSYIGRMRRGGRKHPRFPIHMWNMKERVEYDLPRTNNSLEGWHNSLQANVTACHPNIWTFIDVLRKQQSLSQLSITQLLAGQERPKKRRKYQDSSNRLKNLVSNFNDESDVLKFLKGVAINLKF